MVRDFQPCTTIPITPARFSGRCNFVDNKWRHVDDARRLMLHQCTNDKPAATYRVVTARRPNRCRSPAEALFCIDSKKQPHHHTPQTINAAARMHYRKAQEPSAKGASQRWANVSMPVKPERVKELNIHRLIRFYQHNSEQNWKHLQVSS